MSSDWKICMLGELGTIKTGKTPASSLGDGFGGTVPFVTPGDMNGQKWITDTDRCLNERGLASVSSSLMPPRSVAVSCIGSDMGKASLLSRPSVTNQQINTIAVDESRFNAEFVYYDLSVRQQELKAAASGSATPILNKGHFSAFEISIPPRATQDKIAEILGKLDDRIAVNRRINQTLEAMAQAIFQSWFVDFDPVKAKIAAKAEGRDPLRAAMSAICGKSDPELDGLSPEQYDLLAATAAMFPDEMKESELGSIPKEWTLQSAETLAEVGIGKTPPRKEPQWFTEGEGDWRWVSIRDMGASGVFQQRSSEFLTADAVSRFNVRVVPDRTVLLSFKLTIGRVAISDGPMVTNEAIAHFKLPSNATISSEYLYLYLKVFDYSTLGSTSSIADAVNSKTIRELPIVVASGDVIDRFTKSVAPLFEEMRNRQNEIASLGATRDALLPKLLSGEIEVPL